MDRKIVLPMLVALALALLMLSACAQPTPAAPAVALDSTATAIPATDTPTPLPPTNTPIPPTDTTVPTDTATPTSTSTPTSTPTDTPRPPTNTPVPPTATLVPPTPTRTRLPPTRTPQVLTLPLALKRTFDTKTYRFEMHMFYSDPYSETEMMNATGERSGSIVHIMMGSMYGKLLTGDPNGRAELMYVGDKTYIRGPVPLYKANEARWYIMPSSKEGANSIKPGDVLTPDVVAYNKIGSEAVDGVACDVYTIDKEAARRALIASNTITAKDMENVVNVEVTYWFCSDGYVHRSRVRADERYVFNPSTTAIMRTEARYFDFNAPIQLAEPTDAIPLPK